MKRISGIYHIVNIINNHHYIGSSVNLHGRMNGHFQNLTKGCHENKHLQNAINKYGIENFQFEILLICDRNMLIYFEQKCIDNLSPEYNISHFVGPGFFRGCRHTDEMKRNMSKLHKGKKISLELRAKLLIAATGRIWDDESKKKLANSLIGNKNSCGRKLSERHKEILINCNKTRNISEETHRKMRESHLGKKLSLESIQKRTESCKAKKLLGYVQKRCPHTEEHKRKIAEAGIGRIASLETRAKLSIANTGKHLSDETKRKISECQIGKVLSAETKKKISDASKGKNFPRIIYEN